MCLRAITDVSWYLCARVRCSRVSLPGCPVGCLSIGHSSGGPPVNRACPHNHTRTFTPKHTQTYSFAHRRSVPMPCHKSELSNRFYSSEWKEERQPPNNLEKTEESKRREVLILLRPMPEFRESVKIEGTVFNVQTMNVYKTQNESIFIILASQGSDFRWSFFFKCCS